LSCSTFARLYWRPLVRVEESYNGRRTAPM
jgi:hypothetical protein